MAVNPSHKATLDVAAKKFGLEISVPDRAPIVSLKKWDTIIVMSVRGLPRLEGRHEYSEQEIAAAEFAFGEWTVVCED